LAEPELPSLDAEDVPTRVAAVRELGLHGKPDIIPRLVELARTDGSPAIRLATAAAAADILSRYRVGPRAKELSLEERRKLLALFNGIDPGVNSGLFSMLASLGLPEAVGRISIGLRDPRGGVRVGAAVGLLRLACSVQAHGDEELEQRIVALLQDKRLKPDALAEVAEVCAAVGYTSAIPVLDELATTGGQADVVGTSLERLQAFQANPPIGGYSSDGRDAGEVDDSPALGTAKLALGPSLSLLLEKGKRTWGEALDQPDLRRLYIRPIGAGEPVEAVQWRGRTWYRVSQAELEEIGLEAIDVEAIDLPKAKKGGVQLNGRRLKELFQEQVRPDSARGRFLRALIDLCVGDVEAAREELIAGAAMKKVPPDLHYFLGELAPTKKAAKENLEAYLTKTKGKGQFAARATKLLKKK
jgi:hypothetical protein